MEIPPELLTTDLSSPAVPAEDVEAAFDYSMKLVSDKKRANVIAAKAMTYAIRGEFVRAHEVLMRNRYGADIGG